MSKELTMYFRCGIVGIDFVIDDFNIPWIVEVNMSNTSLRSGKGAGHDKSIQSVFEKLDLDYKPVDSILNIPKLISKSCVNFIENLNE